MIRRLLAPRRRGAKSHPLEPALTEARGALAAAASSSGPVVAGPFHAEVGYELLYWIPFLRWALSVEPRLGGRLVAVSRGGTASWYEGVASDYVDLYGMLSPEELEDGRAEVHDETRGSRKQSVESRLEQSLARRVGEHLGTDSFLHPRLVFALVRQLIRRPVPRGKDLPFLFEPLPPSPEETLDLPPEFVAVRFYGRASFPETPANTEFVHQVVDALASSSHVVALNPGRRYDDHVDFELKASDRVTVLPDAPPERNLAQQAAVVSRAKAFVGTYGGLAYLAPFVGVDSLSFYSETNFLPQHLELAARVFAEPPYGRLVALDTRSAGLVRSALRL